MLDLFGNHIVGFPTRWLISVQMYVHNSKVVLIFACLGICFDFE